MKIDKLRRQKYNLTEREAEDLVKIHNGQCAICKSKYKLCIDHDHKTGLVRGLLCNRCNFRLGVLELVNSNGDIDKFNLYLELHNLRVRRSIRRHADKLGN